MGLEMTKEQVENKINIYGTQIYPDSKKKLGNPAILITK